MIDKNDWRLHDSQYGKQLKGQTFEFRKYEPIEKNNDHDHCAFCNIKFYPTIIDDYCVTEGYVTVMANKKVKQSHWVCQKCFNDFKEILDLKSK